MYVHGEEPQVFSSAPEVFADWSRWSFLLGPRTGTHLSACSSALKMHCFDVLVSAATVAFVLSNTTSAFPTSRHHHAKADKQRQHKEHHHQQQQQQKQVSAQQSRNDLAINKMQQSEESATEATAAEFSTSALSNVAMWEYNIFLDDDRLNLQYDDYDYADDYDLSKGQYENDDYYDEQGPTIQNLILLAAKHPRRNRNVFGLPPREVVIY